MPVGRWTPWPWPLSVPFCQWSSSPWPLSAPCGRLCSPWSPSGRQHRSSAAFSRWCYLWTPSCRRCRSWRASCRRWPWPVPPWTLFGKRPCRSPGSRPPMCDLSRQIFTSCLRPSWGSVTGKSSHSCLSLSWGSDADPLTAVIACPLAAAPPAPRTTGQGHEPPSTVHAMAVHQRCAPPRAGARPDRSPGACGRRRWCSRQAGFCRHGGMLRTRIIVSEQCWVRSHELLARWMAESFDRLFILLPKPSVMRDPAAPEDRVHIAFTEKLGSGVFLDVIQKVGIRTRNNKRLLSNRTLCFLWIWTWHIVTSVDIMSFGAQMSWNSQAKAQLVASCESTS